MPTTTQTAVKTVKYTDIEASALIAKDMIDKGLIKKGESVTNVKILFRPGLPGEGMLNVFQGFEYEITSKS